MADKDIEFQTHTCTDSPDGSAVIVFNTGIDGDQDQQICVVPIYAGAALHHPIGDYDEERRRAEEIACFVRSALQAFVKTPEGNTAYKHLLPHLYHFAKKYGPQPEYFDGMRVCPTGHTFHIDDPESFVQDGEPGERRCPVCQATTV